jgi:hypothetical protein
MGRPVNSEDPAVSARPETVTTKESAGGRELEMPC